MADNTILYCRRQNILKLINGIETRIDPLVQFRMAVLIEQNRKKFKRTTHSLN